MSEELMGISKPIYFQGVLSVEQALEVGMKKDANLGIQFGEDGRIWICLDGQALLRFMPMENDPHWPQEPPNVH